MFVWSCDSKHKWNKCITFEQSFCKHMNVSQSMSKSVFTICYIVCVLYHLQAFNPKSANHNNSRLLVILKVIFAISVDPDQTAPLGAV